MREIGGYFEWEMAAQRGPLHADASLVLKSARACVALLLEHERPTRLQVPYYLCDEALEPVEPSGTEVVWYGLDADLEIDGGPPVLEDGERILYVNYFGLKTAYVRRLETVYGDRLWVDDVQAFHHVAAGSPAVHFNSARKFVGVPDGAYLYLPSPLAASLSDVGLPRNENYRLDHLTLRLESRTAEGHGVFQENDALAGGEVTAVSAMGEAMLARIDYPAIAEVRRENYAYVHTALGAGNRLPGGLLDLGNAVPYCYPYLPERPLAREPLWERKIFVPILWRECVDRLPDGFAWERDIAAHMLPLPIDQRCDRADLDRMIAAVRELSANPGARS